MFDEHKLVLLRNRLEPLNFHVYDLDQSLLGQRLVHSASSASSQGTLKKKTSERSGLTGALAGVTGVAKRQLMGKAELRIDNLEEGVAKTMWLVSAHSHPQRRCCCSYIRYQHWESSTRSTSKRRTS